VVSVCGEDDLTVEEVRTYFVPPFEDDIDAI
jgi:hypothetical protein